ncbi:MAG: hypothetical protein ABI364_05610 [Caldimonas sp.]
MNDVEGSALSRLLKNRFQTVHSVEHGYQLCSSGFPLMGASAGYVRKMVSADSLHSSNNDCEMDQEPATDARSLAMALAAQALDCPRHAQRSHGRGFAMLTNMSTPVRKISETILDFGEPRLGQLDAALPPEVVESTFEIVITVWNAYVMAMPRWGQPRFLTDLYQRMRDPQMPSEMVEALRTLSQRRLERFANDARAVGEWSVLMEVDHWRLRCDARAPADR